MKGKKELLYTTVYNDILSKIKSGEYSVGEKLPTEIELTQKYGVSRITVARALRDLANINLVYRIKKSGTFVNGKVDKSTQLIIPVILPFSEEFNDLFKGIQSASLPHNIFMPFYDTKNNVTKERNALEELLKTNPDGLLVYPCAARDNIDVYSEMLSKKIPIVCLDRNIYGLTTPLVTTTNAKNMEQIVSYLAKQGHQHIGYFSVNDRMAVTEEERFKGYCSGLIKNNIKVKMEYVFDSTDMHRREINLTQKQQSRLFNKYVARCIDEYEKLVQKPSAICCVNDRSMHAFYDAATKRGIRIPEDLVLTGFDCIDDDNDFISSHNIISVKQNFFEIGATAMRLILKILNDQSYLMNELISGTLIINKNRITF